MTNLACVFRARGEQEQDVMKQVVGQKKPTNNHRHNHDRSNLHRATPGAGSASPSFGAKPTTLNAPNARVWCTTSGSGNKRTPVNPGVPVANSPDAGAEGPER